MHDGRDHGGHVGRPQQPGIGGAIEGPGHRHDPRPVATERGNDRQRGPSPMRVGRSKRDPDHGDEKEDRSDQGERNDLDEIAGPVGRDGLADDPGRDHRPEPTTEQRRERRDV